MGPVYRYGLAATDDSEEFAGEAKAVLTTEVSYGLFS
jgi:hypothetical protein